MKVVAFLAAFWGLASVAAPKPIPYLDCRVIKPCSQRNILNYCVDRVALVPKADRTARLVASYQNRSVKILPGNPAEDFYQSGKKGQVFYFAAGWDSNEHWVKLYSNDGQTFGGTLALEEDASFRVLCSRKTLQPLHNR